MDTVNLILEFLLHLIKSEAFFTVFAFLAIFIQSLAMYALWVSHMNKTILLKRKEMGMNEVDQAVAKTFKVMNGHFLTLAKERFGQDYFNKKETAIYRYLLTLALDERKPVYRARIRKNHFDEKSPSEWSKYVHDCIDDDILFITEYLDTHYHPQARIPRPDIYEWNQSRVDEIRHELENLFAELLHIAENNKLKRFFGYKLEIGGGS